MHILRDLPLFNPLLVYPMRFGILLFVLAGASAQAPDAAYQALQLKQYDQAISLFIKAIEADPGKAALRKDLAYTYLKIGEREAAREQFSQAMRLDPADPAHRSGIRFLCFETHKKAEARRISTACGAPLTGHARGHRENGLSEYRPSRSPPASNAGPKPSAGATTVQHALRTGPASRAARRARTGSRAL